MRIFWRAVLGVAIITAPVTVFTIVLALGVGLQLWDPLGVYADQRQRAETVTGSARANPFECR